MNGQDRVNTDSRQESLIRDQNNRASNGQIKAPS